MYDLCRLSGVGVEAVGVLHDELARAQDAEPRPELVAELRRDLVEVDGQLLVRVDLRGGVEREHLLGGRPEHVPAPVPVLEPEHGLAVIHVPPGLLPQFHRLEARHDDLLRPGPVHLLADDVDDLLERPPPQRQIRIRAAGDLADQARPDHQLMTGDLRLGGHFLHRRDQHLAVSHVILESRPSSGPPKLQKTRSYSPNRPPMQAAAAQIKVPRKNPSMVRRSVSRAKGHGPSRKTKKCRSWGLTRKVPPVEYVIERQGLGTTTEFKDTSVRPRVAFILPVYICSLKPSAPQTCLP